MNGLLTHDGGLELFWEGCGGEKLVLQQGGVVARGVNREIRQSRGVMA